MSSRPADDPHRHASQRFLGTIHKNVGDPQPVLLRAQVHYQLLSQAGVDLRHAHTARDAALEHGLAFRWRDDEGQVRYGLTPEGVAAVEDASMPIYDRADEDALRAVLETETSRPEPDKAVIGWANTHLLSLPEPPAGSGGERNV